MPFVLGNIATAATYYLDAVNGNDSAPGTSTEPWKTLSKAQSIVSEGDTVKLRNGNYGTFSDGTGNRSNWITWEADEGHNNVNMVHVNLGQGPGYYNMYLRFDGINVEGGPKPGENENRAVRAYYVNYVEFLNMTVFGTAPYRRDYQSAGIFLFNANHIKIKNCTIHGFREQIVGQPNTNNDDILIEDCSLYDGFWPVLAYGSNWIVRNNEFRDVWDGINMDCHDSSIEYNYIHDFKPPTPEYHGDGIQIYNHSIYGHQPKNITIRGNIVNTGSHHSLGLRCSADGQGLNIIVENNIAYNATSTNVSLMGLSGVIFRNNTIPDGLVDINNVSSLSISGNLLYRCDIWNADNVDYEDYNILYQWWAHTKPDAFQGPNTTVYGTGKEYLFKANFVDWDNKDFHLAPGSDAIDFCPLAIAPDTDLLGKIRIDIPTVGNDGNTCADAGCYEFDSSLPANLPPVFDPIGNKSVAANSTLTFTVNATDPNGDILTYWASELPEGATFDYLTKTFTWTPTQAQIGIHTATFKVMDKFYRVSETITITVTAATTTNIITVPVDVNSIQAAIDSADNGYTIIVEQGRYCENIHFKDKNIFLKSTDPNDPNIVANTIIDGKNAGSVVTFNYSAPPLTNASLNFSTGPDITNSWFATKSGDVITMNFSNIEVDDSTLADNLLYDTVRLPSMVVTNIIAKTLPGIGDVYEATLNPIPGSMLTLTDNTSGTVVMSAAVNTGSMIAIGTNWTAYSESNDDLTGISTTTPGYSAVVDSLVSTYENKPVVDLSFSGNSSAPLYALLGSTSDGAISGTLSGQINVVYTPKDKNTSCKIAGFTITSGRASQGGGVYIDSACPLVEKNVIIANNALKGGGIYCKDDSAIIRLNKIIKNYALLGTGGAIYCTNSSAVLENNLITNNTARYGSSILWFGGKPTILNNTIACNLSTSNSFSCGIAADSSESPPIIKNNIIAFNNNGAGIHNLGGLTPDSFTYNNVFGNLTRNYGRTFKDQTGYNGNISIDPFFFNADKNDYHLKSQAGRWDPKNQGWLTDSDTSPCIDAGDPNSNFAEELWPHGQLINMGAYGGTPQASLSVSDTGNIADLNNDGIVNLADMALITKKWLTSETLLTEDLDSDGVVNFRDFAIFSIQLSED
ncbi:MAG: right-handed parallel beta-helix repeat-containing protein [Phycisphaerae bacterium]|nr:right-handed parallel beta-helix repeat-containing protein [Phycisphaerae bacterium]